MRVCQGGHWAPLDPGPLGRDLAALGLRPGHLVGLAAPPCAVHLALHALRREVGYAVQAWSPRAPGNELEAARAACDAWVDIAPASPAAPPLAVTVRANDALPAPRHLPGSALVRTSGTTGPSKPVALTRSMLDAHALACQGRIQDGPGSRWLATLPLHHVGGVALLDRCLRYGNDVVLAPFASAECAQLLHEHAITHVSLVPAMLQRLLDAGATPPASLRVLLLGGDRAPEGLMRAALAAGWPVHATYGLTEACSQVATATPREWLERPGTVGRPLPGFTVTTPDGQIEVAGPSVAGGGTVRTGDTGRLDADGFLFVTGRRDELIVTGGEKVDPAVVEAALRGAPGVADVAVVGLPDARWGQAVQAALVAGPGFDLAQAKAIARAALPPHAVPKGWHLVDHVPRTEAGKLQRALVRERLAALVG